MDIPIEVRASIISYRNQIMALSGYYNRRHKSGLYYKLVIAEARAHPECWDEILALGLELEETIAQRKNAKPLPQSDNDWRDLDNLQRRILGPDK
jgi:hypothetical protein